MPVEAPKLSGTYTLKDLIDVMRALRDPAHGCPWDLEQDFKSIAPYTIEEAYEVADAIDRSDMVDLCEELGDLLLQSIYHAQMASELGIFDIHNVIHDITAKMIHRHPHVFGTTQASSAADVNKIWDQKKSQEKTRKSALDGITQALPALLKAQKLQNKAAKVGFEWPAHSFVQDKLTEELAELKEATESRNIDYITEELGDVLFVLVNYGRMLGINAEEALRRCNTKFERRFRGLESDLVQEGINLKDATLQQMESSWCAQKKKERSA